MAPTSIETFQNSRCNRKNLTACVELTIYETALRVAELQGYETVSSFVKDAILDRIKLTASAMSSIASDNYTMK